MSTLTWEDALALLSESRAGKGQTKSVVQSFVDSGDPMINLADQLEGKPTNIRQNVNGAIKSNAEDDKVATWPKMQVILKDKAVFLINLDVVAKAKAEAEVTQ